MATLPALLLNGFLTIEYPLDYNMDPDSPAFGAAHKWAASMTIDPQIIGIPLETYSYSYDASTIKVGDWVASSDNGFALQISEITSLNDLTSISVILEDVDSYNAIANASGTLDGVIPSAECIVFSTNEFGFPVIGPLELGKFPEVTQANILARFNQQAKYEFPGGGGGSDELGPRTEGFGNYSDGAVMDWVPGTTTKDNAIGDLNYILKYAFPKSYTDVSELTLPFAYSGQGMVSEPMFYLANDPTFINNTTYVPVLDEQFKIVFGLATETPNYVPTETDIGIAHVGPTQAGTISFLVNDVVQGEKILDWNDNNGTYGGLTIQNESPTPFENIWKKASIRLSASLQDGFNSATLTSSISGSVTDYLMVEPLTDFPTFSDISVVDLNNSELMYSSGIPHYGNGEWIAINGTLTNSVGRTYPEEFIECGPQRYAHDDLKALLGTPNIEAFLPSTSITNFVLSSSNAPINSTRYELISGYTNNSYTFANQFKQPTNTWTTTSNVLYWIGESPSAIFENPTPTSMNAGIKRVATPDGQTPVIGPILWDTNFDSGSQSSIGDMAPHEAAVIAGSARFCNIDFSTDHFPVGPNYSAHNPQQYITFKIQQVSNRLRLKLEGDFAGMWVKLPGVSNPMPNATNGWWNALVQADFPPTLYPGHDSAGDGCLLNMEDGFIDLTFGSLSSAYSQDNIILVRFELIFGQEITTLSLAEY